MKNFRVFLLSWIFRTNGYILIIFIFFCFMEPLSSLLRPKNLADFVGQKHLIGPGKPLSTFLEHKKIPSLLFRGPPGCGKTTLAHIIAQELQADFFVLSGVRSKKEELMEIIKQAELNQKYGKATLIFLDEIHRRNKSQQDTLLPFVEKGSITLIGATTENPSFSINNALLSRTRLFVFEKISPEEVFTFLLAQKEKIWKCYPEMILSDESLYFLAGLSNGDLRSAINLLESALLLLWKGELTSELLIQAWAKQLYYDRDGEEHYTIISAVHKSLRDSDPNAACYWIQRMLVAGEDPLYIARRLLRFASEDIGPADNNALLLANQVYEAIQKIWMPECEVFLFQLALYLAKAPKSNLTYKIAQQTKADVEKYWNLPVPLHLRNAPTKMMEELGYGKGYQYAHDFKDAKVDQEHFPPELKGRRYG